MPLEKHVATVAEFLRKSSKANDDEKSEWLYSFHCYLAASCWNKMEQRISHRYSRAMSSTLNTLTPQTLHGLFQKHATNIKPSMGKDSTLTRVLVKLEEQGLLQSILEEHLEEPQAVYLNSTDSRRLVDELRAVSSSQIQQRLGAYNEHTCFVFHLLLIAAIGGFRHYLGLLRETEVDQKRREDYAQQALQFGRLLWRIGYSRMLTHHLRLLAAGNFLHTPVDANMRYTTYENSPATGDSTDNREDDGEGDDVAEDVEWGADSTSPANKFRRWIQLLVSYWAAPDILSKSVGAEGADITLVHVRRKYDRIKMERWDSTIRRLASSPAAAESTDSFDAESAINAFKSNIESPYFDAKSVMAFRKSNSTSPSTGKYEAASPENVKFDGNIHCEMALVLLVKPSAWAQHGGDTLLQDLISVRILPPSICIKLMSCTGYESKFDRSVEAVLLWLLGVLGRIQGG
jgi:hypothetical protein